MFGVLSSVVPIVCMNFGINGGCIYCFGILMSHRHISVPCKVCGSPMGNAERIKRRLFQGTMFPYSGRFECIACGKKQSFINLNRYISRSDLRKYKEPDTVKSADNGMRKVSVPNLKKLDDSSVLDLESYKSLRSIVVQQQHKIHALEAKLSRLQKHH